MSQHATPTPEAINTMNSPSTSPKKGKSESPKPSSTRSVSPSPYNNSNNNNVKHEVDILSLQKELQDKQHELTIAYQTSLELVETNTELQNQLDEQTITIQQLDASITDYETKMELLEAENQEYQQTINQTNEKYEEALGELAVSRDHLHNAQDEIKEYQRTMQSLNHDIIHNTNDSPLRHKSKHQNGGQGGNYDGIDYKEKMEKQQKKYDELLRECEKYRNEHEQLIEYQIELENMRKDALKFEKRNKLLSDQIVELTYNNVQLEKEINEYNVELEENQETIQFLENENEKLLTSNANMADNGHVNNGNDEHNVSKATDHKIRLMTIAGPDTTLDRFVMNNNNSGYSATQDLKRRLSVQIRDNFGYNENLLMFADKIDANSENGSHRGWDDNLDGIDEHESGDIHGDEDLFTIHQNYEDNEEYLDQNIDNITNGTGTDHGDREESVSELSDADKGKQMLDEVKDDEKKEEEEKADSISPKTKESDITPLVLANKSREEKALDPKAQRKGSKSSSKSSPAPSPSNREYNDRLSRLSKIKSKRENKRKSRVSRSGKKKASNIHARRVDSRQTDALDEYLHLTASAVKINYPTVNATSKELIEMVKSMPFYQAHDHLNRYMMDRLRWEQIQQNKLLQLKAAAIQSQKDHQMSQQSAVTRLFKKWFTSEYDDPDHIINGNDNNKGNKVDLSTPMTKNENLKVHRVGKAKMKKTKSGGRSVNLGSLQPAGIPPKGTTKKRKVASSTGSRKKDGSKGRRTSRSAKSDAKAMERRRKRKEKEKNKKLKSMAIAQTLPSSKMNDKNVQKMLAFTADKIDEIVQNDEDWTEQPNKPTIRITVPVKGQKEMTEEEKEKEKIREQILNAEEHPDNKSLDVDKKRKRKKSPQPPAEQQRAGWFSGWFSGGQQPQPRVIDVSKVGKGKGRDKKRRGSKKKGKGKSQSPDDNEEFADPYALAGSEKKKRRNSKEKKERRSRKSKSPRNPRKKEDKDGDKDEEQMKEINLGDNLQKLKNENRNDRASVDMTAKINDNIANVIAEQEKKDSAEAKEVEDKDSDDIKLDQQIDEAINNDKPMTDATPKSPQIPSTETSPNETKEDHDQDNDEPPPIDDEDELEEPKRVTKADNAPQDINHDEYPVVDDDGPEEIQQLAKTDNDTDNLDDVLQPVDSNDNATDNDNNVSLQDRPSESTSFKQLPDFNKNEDDVDADNTDNIDNVKSDNQQNDNNDNDNPTQT